MDEGSSENVTLMASSTAETSTIIVNTRITTSQSENDTNTRLVAGVVGDYRITSNENEDIQDHDDCDRSGDANDGTKDNDAKDILEATAGSIILHTKGIHTNSESITSNEVSVNSITQNDVQSRGAAIENTNESTNTIDVPETGNMGNESNVNLNSYINNERSEEEDQQQVLGLDQHDATTSTTVSSTTANVENTSENHTSNETANNANPDEDGGEDNNATNTSIQSIIDNNDTLTAATNINVNSSNSNNSNNNPNNNDNETEHTDEPIEQSMARTRWIRINQQFQILLTLVTLIFSILLFCILVCWVVFTSAFVMSVDQPCDVPLKTYFWLATMQLILELFRTDIMQYMLRWDSRSRGNVPARVIIYNLVYIIYAMLVLRLGIASVFPPFESKCSQTAPELYQTAAVFIFLMIGVWCTILFGYILPFVCVIIILTQNGYAPTNDIGSWGNVFSTGSRGAPEGTIDLLTVVSFEDTPESECCICMEDFTSGDYIVMTECKHVFHRSCCQEWLLQSSTCPVCRTDIPTAFGEQRSNINATSMESNSNDNISNNNNNNNNSSSSNNTNGNNNNNNTENTNNTDTILETAEEGRIGLA